MSLQKARFTRASGEGGTKLTRMCGKAGTDCLLLVAAFKEQDALLAAGGQGGGDTHDEGALDRRGSVGELREPAPLSGVIQENLVVGARKAQGQNSAAIA